MGYKIRTAVPADEGKEAIRKRKTQIEQDESRISELKRLFVKIYEDNAAGRLNDDRYEMLSRMYEDEQKKLEAEVIRLRREIDEQETKHEELERFIEKAKAYVGIRKLDGYILHELVKAIYVESPRRVDGKKEQRIHIEYNGIGFIPIYDLIEQETA